MAKNACQELAFLNGTKDFVKAELMLKIINVQDAQPHRNVDGQPEHFCCNVFLMWLGVLNVHHLQHQFGLHKIFCAIQKQGF